MSHANLADYNAQMRHTAGNKLFWLKGINPEDIGLVVDFGCADANVLKVASRLLPDDCSFVGIDKDPSQIAAAKAHFVAADSLSTDWEMADQFLNDMQPGKKSVLVLSSVIHEMGDDFPRWWREEVETRRFDYVAIRDFARPEYPKGFAGLSYPRACLTQEEFLALRFTQIKWSHGRSCAGLREGVLHGLLKAVHWEDLEREHEEDYFRWSVRQMLDVTTSTRLYAFRLNGIDTTITPFFRRWCEKRGIVLDPTYDKTHVEMLLERRTY